MKKPRPRDVQTVRAYAACARFAEFVVDEELSLEDAIKVLRQAVRDEKDNVSSFLNQVG